MARAIYLTDIRRSLNSAVSCHKFFKATDREDMFEGEIPQDNVILVASDTPDGKMEFRRGFPADRIAKSATQKDMNFYEMIYRQCHVPLDVEFDSSLPVNKTLETSIELVLEKLIAAEPELKDALTGIYITEATGATTHEGYPSGKKCSFHIKFGLSRPVIAIRALNAVIGHPQASDYSDYEDICWTDAAGKRRCAIDSGIYTRNRNFRMLGQSKLKNPERRLVVAELDDDFADGMWWQDKINDSTNGADYLICHYGEPHPEPFTFGWEGADIVVPAPPRLAARGGEVQVSTGEETLPDSEFERVAALAALIHGSRIDDRMECLLFIWALRDIENSPRMLELAVEQCKRSSKFGDDPNWVRTAGWNGYDAARNTCSGMERLNRWAQIDSPMEWRMLSRPPPPVYDPADFEAPASVRTEKHARVEESAAAEGDVVSWPIPCRVIVRSGIVDEIQRLDDILKYFDQGEVAKIFYDKHPTDYIYHPSVGWYELDHKTNLWSALGKVSAPGNMRNTIEDSMKATIDGWKEVKLRDLYEKWPMRPEDQKAAAEFDQVLQFIERTHERRRTDFGNSAFLSGVITFLTSRYHNEAALTKMNMARHLFAFGDGLCLDLSALCVRWLLATDYMSFNTKFAFPKHRSAAKRAQLDNFLNNTFLDPKERLFFMQETASCMYGENRAERFYVKKGTGRNGKGFTAKLIQCSFGDYFMSANANFFTVPPKGGDEAAPQLMELRGKRYLDATEPEASAKLQSGWIKALTGGDSLKSRALYGELLTWTNTATCHIQCNGEPEFNKTDRALKLRTVVLDFKTEFVKMPNPANPLERLIDERLKGDVAKDIAMQQEFIMMLWDTYIEMEQMYGGKIQIPDSVLASTNETNAANNVLSDWLAECYEVTTDDKDTVKFSELKASYASHSGRAFPGRDIDFRKQLVENGMVAARNSSNCSILRRVKPRPAVEESE